MSSKPRSYEKKFENLLAGGLNLMPPGDVLDAGDALILENWRPELDGSLRSRRGNFRLDFTAAGIINSLFKVDVVNPTWWLGDDSGVLYEIGGHTLTVTGFAGVGTPGLNNPGLWPISMTAFGGNLYAVTQQKQVRIGSTVSGGAGGASGAVTGGQVAAPTTGSVSGVGGGSFTSGEVVTYYLTFNTADGESAGKTLTFTSGASQSAQIILPVFTNPAILGVNIYRQSGALTQPYRVATNQASGSTYTDTGSTTQSDQSLADANVPYESDHQLMPPGAVIGGPYFGHLLIANSVVRPSRFWWSKQGNPNAWPGATASGLDLVDGNWSDVGDDLDPIVAISIFPQFCIFYRVNSIWRLVGDPDDQYSVLEPLIEGFGICGPKAWCKAGRVDYFGTTDGIYRLNGENVAKVSRRIQKVFDSDWHEFSGVMPPMPGPNQRYAMALGHRNGRIYVTYNDGTASP